MKTCTCSVKTSEIRFALNGPRCKCGATLNDRQFQLRVVSQLNELGKAVSDLKTALHSLGATQCGNCREWKVGNLTASAVSWCADCLRKDPWIAISEDDDELEARDIAHRVLRYMAGKGRIGMRLEGLFAEEWQKIAR